MRLARDAKESSCYASGGELMIDKKPH